MHRLRISCSTSRADQRQVEGRSRLLPVREVSARRLDEPVEIAPELLQHAGATDRRRLQRRGQRDQPLDVAGVTQHQREPGLAEVHRQRRRRAQQVRGPVRGETAKRRVLGAGGSKVGAALPIIVVGEVVLRPAASLPKR